MSSVPAQFSDFYKKLVTLRFPLEVAEILELRYMFNSAVDHMVEPQLTRDFRDFCEQRRRDIEALRIDKAHHISRLTKLLAALRQFHLAHTIDSRDTEAYLRKALANNARAATLSLRYGKWTLGATLVAIGLWAALIHPGWWVQLATFVLGYLSADYFYSLSTLKRERSALSAQLQDVLNRRVSALQWPTLTKNVALILGYAKISGVEAFVLEGEHEDYQRSYA